MRILAISSPSLISFYLSFLRSAREMHTAILDGINSKEVAIRQLEQDLFSLEAEGMLARKKLVGLGYEGVEDRVKRLRQKMLQREKEAAALSVSMRACERACVRACKHAYGLFRCVCVCACECK